MGFKLCVVAPIGLGGLRGASSFILKGDWLCLTVFKAFKGTFTGGKEIIHNGKSLQF